MKLQHLHLACAELGLDVRLAFDRAANSHPSTVIAPSRAHPVREVEEAPAIRPVTLVYGGPGVGKTVLLSAIGHTRPGHTVNLNNQLGETQVVSRCSWLAGLDAPDRTSPLELSTPSREDVLFSPGLGLAAAANATTQSSANAERRREAALFDRLAREGGFVFGAFSALRWFSHAPLLLNSPERTLTRHDVKAFDPLGDATRHDLTRPTLAILAFAECSSAIKNQELCEEDHQLLAGALRNTLAQTLEPMGARYLGLNPQSLEPCFRQGSRVLPFRQLPAQLQNVVAITAGTVRLLWAGYPGLNPQLAQGVIAIDEVERYLDAAQADALLNALSRAFREVQWIATTRSPELLALRDATECVVLRRGSEEAEVQAFVGDSARIH